MSWEAAAALGELGGAIAVVATLFFLYKQILLTRRELERANFHQSAQSTMSNNSLYVQIWQPVMQDKELAEIYLRALNGEPLSQVDSLRFSIYVNTVFALGEAAYFQTASGIGFDELSDDAEQVIEVFGRYMCSLLETEAGESWFESEAPALFTEDFLNAVRAQKEANQT